MNAQTIGAIIRRERKACGLSQNALAHASNISRITLLNVEKGTVDIGATKLATIAENLGISLFSRGQNMDFIKATLNNINTSYKKIMGVSEFETLLLKGKVEPGFEGQVFHLIDETPTKILSGAIKQIAHKKSIDPKIAWKNLSKIAHQAKSPNSFWKNVA